MRLSLHEEYIKRHNPSAKVVLYKPKTCVLLHSKTHNKWRIFSAYWRNHDRHPGFFELSYSEVIHNGFEKKQYVKDVGIGNIAVSWHEYEKSVLQIVSEIKKEDFRAFCFEERILGAWEAFLLMTDSYLAKNFEKSFYCQVEQSLCKDLSILEREKACLRCLEYIIMQASPVYDFWQYQIAGLARNDQSEWLVDLIND